MVYTMYRGGQKTVKQMEKYKIITTNELEAGINLTKEEFKYLDELFYISEEVEEFGDFDELSIFEGDPDYIKVLGEEGRGEIPFITVSVDDVTIYILSSLYLDHYGYFDTAVEILEWFIGGAKNSKEIDNNWHDWDTVREGVAYRGGQGYHYSLYAKELM